MAQELLVTTNKEFAVRGTRDERTLPTLFEGLIGRDSHWAADLSLNHPVRRVMHVQFLFRLPRPGGLDIAFCV